MTAITDLNEFEIEEAEVSLWVFKKQSPSGVAPKFTGRWIEMSDELDQQLRELIETQRALINESLEYSLLAQNNESSALLLSSIETHAALVVEAAAAELPSKAVSRIAQLENTVFYAIKLVSGGAVLFAVKKSDTSWQTKRSTGFLSVVFTNDTLDLAPARGFDLHKSVDFFVVQDELLIRHKANFESVLNYKQSHTADFTELSAEVEFHSIFTELTGLSNFVGDNKIQLRRMSAVRQKGHYRDAGFMDRLREHGADLGLEIVFDANGKIVPTAESCRDIINALLDHRLTSAFSQNIYDVPDATAVDF